MDTTTPVPHAVTVEREKIANLKESLHFFSVNTKRSIKSVEIKFEHRKFHDKGFVEVKTRSLGDLDDFIPAIEKMIWDKIEAHEQIIRMMLED